MLAGSLDAIRMPPCALAHLNLQIEKWSDINKQEKIIKGSVIGSRKGMMDAIRIASDYNIEVVVNTFPLEKTNEVLSKLKVSEIKSRAVLLPHQ